MISILLMIRPIQTLKEMKMKTRLIMMNMKVKNRNLNYIVFTVNIKSHRHLELINKYNSQRKKNSRKKYNSNLEIVKMVPK